jgi:hypothetical protein
MGYYGEATQEEIEREEYTAWSLRTPDDARDLPVQERYRRTQEADLRHDFRVWVSEPEDDWVTAAELINSGYKPEAIIRLFGPLVDGPDGIKGWLVTHVEHIEETVIDPAIDLLKASFIEGRLEETFSITPGGGKWPSNDEASAMAESLMRSGDSLTTRAFSVE